MSTAPDFRSRSNSGGRPLRSPARTPGKARSASGGRKPRDGQHALFADFSAGNDDGEETSGIESSKIKVFVRIRPTYSRDAESVRIRCGKGDKSVIVLQGDKMMSFPCDTVFGERATQADVYERLGHNLLTQFVEGRNVCVFAYGQTGSGKTHSILGSENDPGMLPLFCRELFRLVGESVKKQEVTVEASFFELYLEKAYDLLAPQRVQLRVRGADTAYLEGLTSVQVMRFHELLSVLEMGVAKRATTATLVNEFSSRSHAIFQIVFRRTISEVVNGVEKKSVVTSSCYFVDLAGSERLDMIGSNGNRAETLNINCSLLALQKVIDAKAAPISTFVNYRESILTRLLKECFGGNSVTSLLATVSPEMQYTGVSIGTLRFASKAALVRQTPKANVDPFVSAVQDLKAENDEMRVELEQLRSHARLSAQPSQKGRPSICCRREAPCLVELFEDGALNVWFKVTADGIAVSAPAHDSPAFTCRGSGTAHHLTAHADDVVVNGTAVAKDAEVPICNRDRIAIGGMRFFVFCARDESNAALPTFHSAKLEYVQSTFETLREKLREEARQVFEQDRNEIVRQMKEQLEKTREELDTVRAAQASDVGKANDLAERKFDLENCAEENHQFQLTLVNEEPTDLLSGLRDMDDAEKTALIEMETKVSAINNLLDLFRKRDLFAFKLVQNAPSETQRVYVRLHNAKARTFADLSNAEFDRVYELLVQIYHNSPDIADGVEEVESILYGGDWKWTSSVPGRRSNIFSMALYNSMCDVARTRRRSVAQVQRTFTSRKSILSDAIEQAMKVKKLACQSALDTHFQLLVACQTSAEDNAARHQPFTHNLIRWSVELGNCLRDADRQVANCRKKTVDTMDLSCTGMSSPDQVAIHAVMKFLVAVTRLETAVLSVSRTKEPMDVLATEMLDVVSAIATERDRWIHAVHSKSETSRFFLKIMNQRVNMLLTLIGRYAFLVGDRFPTSFETLSAAVSDDNLSVRSSSDETEHSNASSHYSTTSSAMRAAVKPREMFHAGIVQSIDAACAKDGELRDECAKSAGSCDLSAAALALCDGTEALQTAIKAEPRLDERVVLDVMRSLLYARNQLLGGSPPLEEITRRLMNLRMTMIQLMGDAQPSRSLVDALRFAAGSASTAVAKLQKARMFGQTSMATPTMDGKLLTRRVDVLTSRNENNYDGAADENRPPPAVLSYGPDNSIEGRSMMDLFVARRLDDTINDEGDE